MRARRVGSPVLTLGFRSQKQGRCSLDESANRGISRWFGPLLITILTLLLHVTSTTAEVFSVTDTFDLPSDESISTNGTSGSDPLNAAANATSINTTSPSALDVLDARNEVLEPPVLNKPEAKVDAVMNNKKDFVDDIDAISRRILALEQQGVFAIMNASVPPAQFDAQLRDSIVLAQSGLVQVMAKKLIAERLRMSPETAGIRMQRVTFRGTRMESTCIPEDPTRCDPQAPYRSITGVCNNLDHKMWGRSLTPLVRIIPAKYDDGIWAMRKSVTGEDLPLVRNVSIKLAKHVSNPSFVLTMLQMTYGQFLGHDMSHVKELTDGQGQAFLCCAGGKQISLRAQHPACENIIIPPEDDFYPTFQVECINFVRSQLSPKLSCAAGHQDQLNSLTSFLDLSNMYGNSEASASAAREFSGGRLRVGFRNGRQLLRMAPNMRGCGEPDRPCFISAGDEKVNTVPSLVAVHLLWHREHERISGELLRANPSWSDETLFQETRRIAIAAYQHIFLNEYTPTLFGPDMLRKYGLELSPPGTYSCSYNASVNPAIANEFSTGAFRFGHSQIADFYLLHDEFDLVEDLVGLHKTFMRPGNLIHDGPTFTKFLRGLMLQPAQQFENFFSSSITTQLFRTSDKPFGFDLISFNIQRGRDHGLPPYVEVVAACGMPKPRTFDDLTPLIGRIKAGALAQVYRDVADVDLYVGGTCENPMKDSLFGPTFACIIGDQLQRLRIGDRFFYDSGSATDCNSTVGHPSPFSQRQLAEIKKASMAALLCDHGEGIGSVSQFPFRLRTSRNMKVDCRSVPRMDLTVFADSGRNARTGIPQQGPFQQPQAVNQQDALQQSFGGPPQQQQPLGMRDARQPLQMPQLGAPTGRQDQVFNPFSATTFSQPNGPISGMQLANGGTQGAESSPFSPVAGMQNQGTRQSASGQQAPNGAIIRPPLFSTLIQGQQESNQQQRPSQPADQRPPSQNRPGQFGSDGMSTPAQSPIDLMVQRAAGPGTPTDRPRRGPEPAIFRPHVYSILEG